jgi:apolipoprotein N-acyltransferase
LYLDHPSVAAPVVDRLGHWRASVSNALGLRRAGIAFGAGAVSVLAYAPFFFWPVLFLTFPILVWLIDGAGRVEGRREALRRAALDGWWFGFGFFFAGLFWIGEAFLVEADKFGWALPFAVTLMPAGLALFWAVATVAARAFWRPGVGRLVVLALALAGTEWLRGHVLTGFPWNTIGYALTYPLVLMQSAGLLGIYGLTLWAVPIFSAPLVLAADRPPGQRFRGVLTGLLVAAVPLAVLSLYGAVRLWGGPLPNVEGVKLRIVQPSVPQRQKWQPENQGPIFRDHLDLSRHDAAGQRDDLAGITHVVWPEAAMPFLPLEHPEALSAIGDLLPSGAFLLTGALRREPIPAAQQVNVGASPFRAFNSLMVFDTEGGLVSVYDKTHLVPFGEYLPLQPWLEAIGLEQLTRMRGGFTEGPQGQPAITAGALPPAGGLICYEAIFPGLVLGQRAQLLINVTNDGWFGNTIGPQQHFHQARVRAVESGLPLVRAANNGISALVDPKGRVVGKLNLNARGTLDVLVPIASATPPYGLYGDWIFALNALIFLIFSVATARELPNRRRAA